jgi:hypothetical protein
MFVEVDYPIATLSEAIVFRNRERLKTKSAPDEPLRPIRRTI